MDFDLSNPLGVIQQSVQQNNEWSAQQAQKQMDFQKMMSDTAHQRQVADLKAAGLNPVLSAHTQGASTPSGASAQADTSGTMALMDLMSQMIESQTALGLAAARGSSGGSGGYGFSGYTARGNYRSGPVGQVIQDIITGLTGKTPRELVASFSSSARNYYASLDPSGNGDPYAGYVDAISGPSLRPSVFPAEYQGLLDNGSSSGFFRNLWDGVSSSARSLSSRVSAWLNAPNMHSASWWPKRSDSHEEIHWSGAARGSKRNEKK